MIKKGVPSFSLVSLLPVIRSKGRRTVVSRTVSLASVRPPRTSDRLGWRHEGFGRGCVPIFGVQLLVSDPYPERVGDSLGLQQRSLRMFEKFEFSFRGSRYQVSDSVDIVLLSFSKF